MQISSNADLGGSAIKAEQVMCGWGQGSVKGGGRGKKLCTKNNLTTFSLLFLVFSH